MKMAGRTISTMNMIPQYEDDIDEDLEEAQIEWSNLIFLPFHPVFKLFVIFSVILKCILGPIQSVYPIVYCWDTMDRSGYLIFIKYFYWYCCDTIYGTDTFLHIVHRQVTDKAMRREHLPKSACFLLLDIISLIPFFRLVVADICPPVSLWPNILAFTEFIVIYRVVEYFSLVTTHSFWKMVIGFTILLGCSISCISCFWLLLTMHGLCENCQKGTYDWRNFVLHKLNETTEAYTTYVYSSVFVFSFAVNKIIDETKPSTIVEFIGVNILAVLGRILGICVLFPKIFAEAVLRLRRVTTYYSQVKRLVAETKRRNSLNASIEVNNFFTMMWKKRGGINRVPDVMVDLPRYMRVELRFDLMWSVFYHSPILRKTSTPLKRMLCELITPDYKLSGEKIFSGMQSQSHLFYLKSGVVQILSADDGITPIISVTSGTIFGDISFVVPPLKRRIVVRCLTYCEVLFLTRLDYLRALHKHPEERRTILGMVEDRMKHARTLYTCKQHVRGLDRTEDEGIAWVKRRWWEISNSLKKWKKRPTNKDSQKYELPPEEAVFHCGKHIGQLVLCNDIQLQTKSSFANTKFPWILLPQSIFGIIWRRVVVITVFFVLLLYPPNIATTRPIPSWFKLFEFWTNFIYTVDICVSLQTEVSRRENQMPSFAAVMFARCKTLYFILDVMATVWTEYIVVIIGVPQFYHIAQLNRLIKIYILFTEEALLWDAINNPMRTVCYKIVLLEFCVIYLLGYVIFLINRATPKMTVQYFFGERSCEPNMPKEKCEPKKDLLLGIAAAWAMELFFPELLPLTLVDVYYAMAVDYIIYLVVMSCKTLFVAALYLKYREVTNYQYFVSKLKTYYNSYKIHHELLRRLNKYFICYWKYYKGVDIMQNKTLNAEPYDIYWKVQGEVAERIIGESSPFVGADTLLIRELAYAAKFMILPKTAFLFLFGEQIKNVSWIVQGNIKCEFYNEEGELLKVIFGPGKMLCTVSVFLNKAALRTYRACTDCEILYIKIQDFFKIIQRFPNEWIYFQNCIKEIEPGFDNVFQKYVQKHKDYRKKLNQRVFHSRLSLVGSSRSIIHYTPKYSSPHGILNTEVWEDPESDFMRVWILFRSLVAVVSIVAASLQGGSGISIRWYLLMVGAFCDCIAWMDIILKMFLAYYDERGLLITETKRCVYHYLTRGFIVDVIGALPWFESFRVVMRDYIDDDSAIMLNTVCKFCHLYIIIGYFNYIADTPTVNVAFIMIIKWQLVSILIMLGASHYLNYHCVKYTFDGRANLIHTERKNACWMPKFLELKVEPDIKQLQILYAESLNLVQSGIMKMNFGRFHIDRDNLGVGIVLFILGVNYWLVMCYSLTLLVLNSRGNTLFEHGISQLRKFLIGERVDKKLINQASTYFSYWWMRTKGINIHQMTNDRIGLVLLQDLNYFFFQETFAALDSLLLGGETLSRQLASASTEIYILPGQEIMRELQIVPHVYIVHRGRVIISQAEEKIVTLTKGCIFGQLLNAANSPVHVSAISEDYADLLQINKRQFQDIIDDEIRQNIALHPNSKDDFMVTKKRVVEKPNDTINYILRGRQTMKLPFMSEPVEARHGNWYCGCLTVAWLLAPLLSSGIAMTLMTLPRYVTLKMWPCFMVLDIIFFISFVAEFFTLELVVVGKQCIKRIQGLRRFKRWPVYVDMIALLIPILTYVTDDWEYQLVCLLRLRTLYDFDVIFCRSFKSKVAPVLMKFLILILMIHAMSCGWIYVACRDDVFPLDVADISGPANLSIDRDVWVLPKQRKGGCARVARNMDPNSHQPVPGFVVPKHWQDDYIVAFTFIILLHSQTGMSTVVALTLKQIYYKLVIKFLIYVIDLWIVSICISFIYTRFRELYQYDYNVGNLITFLRYSDTSPALLKSINEYTKQLWQRQRGAWLPELAQQAPLCLREDLLCALYIHHLETPPLFRKLPPYFLRQVAARLSRIVIFPGKCIVKEGDMFACMYFIHQGDVEKWYIDKRGDNQMMSLLSTNGYFGTIPGLFPNVPFQFSYHTRTVVDLILLKLRDWQDLLDGYPDVKQDLYASAKQMKKEFGVYRYSI